MIASELNTVSAFEFYESISNRLPQIAPTKNYSTQQADDLLDMAERFDAFVFDAFGVLNVGTTAIPGAVDCITELRQMGKKMVVLTNGASLTREGTEAKLQNYGFDFSSDEIVSSRFAAEYAIAQSNRYWSAETLWGVVTGGKSSVQDLSVKAIALDTIEADFEQVDAFLFLSSSGWTVDLQQLLFESLRRNPRPLVVANPDVVAPKEAGYSLEPGFFAHNILKKLDTRDIAIPVYFFGKPYNDVYIEATRRLGNDIEPKRIAMLGDTLHTDILGAINQGWQSVLVTRHGLFRDYDTAPFILRSKIQPHWIIPGIEKGVV